MSYIIRKWYINELLDIESNNTCQVLKLLTGFIISKQEDGNVLYSKGRTKLIVQHVRDKKLYVNYDKIWSILENKYNIKYKEIQAIVTYIMYKQYGIENYVPLHSNKNVPLVMYSHYKIYQTHLIKKNNEEKISKNISFSF